MIKPNLEQNFKLCKAQEKNIYANIFFTIFLYIC